MQYENTSGGDDATIINTGILDPETKNEILRIMEDADARMEPFRRAAADWRPGNCDDPAYDFGYVTGLRWVRRQHRPLALDVLQHVVRHAPPEGGNDAMIRAIADRIQPPLFEENPDFVRGFFAAVAEWTAEALAVMAACVREGGAS